MTCLGRRRLKRNRNVIHAAMHQLLDLAINAQGGLDRWRTFYAVSARIHTGGTLWETKGHSGALGDIGFKADLLEQKASFIPGPAWHTVYTPHRVAIETGSDEVVEELYNPRATFAGHTWETKWSNLQLAYFTGYATWNYFNTPFRFARPGFELREMEPWEENDETLRRLLVKWPKDVHSHSGEQVFYIDREGLIRRLDYRVEVAGNVQAVHYLSGYREISGIRIATTRTVYLMGADNQPRLDIPPVVTIRFGDIKFA